LKREVPQEHSHSSNVTTVRTSSRREVPQEHSHTSIITAVRKSLDISNPDNIEDLIFALLGNTAAAAGAGSVSDLDCLQQAVADQAFTNAKTAGDVNGMVNALLFRALERNTASVGATSANCTSLTAVNPEIAAISQHQDPASTGAAANNKAVVLALAQQIAAVGGDPQDALQSGTFAPGQIGDPTGAGNTCDVEGDVPGCIFTQNLLVDDATADEITAAAGGVSNTTSAATATAASTAPAAVATNVAAASTTSTSTNSSIGDFGSCSVPQIQFGTGFDGRTETSYEPVDEVSYNHGSADNIDIITQFICNTLTNTCGADQTAKDTCATASTAADAQTKGTGAQADAFNAVFGITTDFAAVAEISDQGVTVTAGVGSAVATPAAASSAAATPAAASSAAATTAAATTAAACPAVTTDAASGTAAAASASSTAVSGANLQTFTGTLGGAAPAVTAGGRGFEVAGEGASESDVGLSAALQRSCSIQHNTCADAANAGSASFTVGDCDTQNTACNAAASA